ncbi:MAG: glycosyltransferase family 2 protein, partial [Sphingobacteriales bacterium]
PLVSIALCTYNGGAHLAEQMDTLVQQDHPNLEIVITDDGSTDETLAIIAQYAQKYPFITLYQNPENLGYARNFERAIGLCRGEMIALADQDDIWEKDKISAMVGAIGDSAMIYHDSAFIFADGKPMHRNMSDVLNMYEGKRPDPFFLYNCASGHAIMFRKFLYEKITPFQTGFFHDWLITITAAEHGGIVYLDRPLVHYRQHAHSNTDILRIKEDSKEKLKSFNELNIRWLEFILPKIEEPAYLQALINCFRPDNSVIPSKRLKLFFLLVSNWKLLFFIKKKSPTSKLNYIRKICFSRTVK